MREIQPGETPVDGGTAVQDNPDRPVFSGNGEFDYVCVNCGNVLAVAHGPRVHDQAGADPLWALPDGQRRRRALGAAGAPAPRARSA